ncbi:hypothetical protein BGZ76_010194 [Entomortierella beljakovae]|nr:hypothetical protein BGZ76_010194 [Entomortierella beljakovae]
MAKRKTTRKTRQVPHSSANDSHPYRGSYSKRTSASPSIDSSPSPQPLDHVHRRRKGNPVRSPSQGDTSKGIVFTFRIQKDSDLSMAVDILSYDQVQEKQGHPVVVPEAVASMKAVTELQQESNPAVTAAAEENNEQEEEVAELQDSFKTESTNLKFAGEQWSSDPSSYLSNNVMDLSRNVLILHSRKPQESSHISLTSPLFHPYGQPSVLSSRSMSVSHPSTPPLTDSGSSSSASSSPSSSPNSPTPFHIPSDVNLSGTEKEELYSLNPLSPPILPLDCMKSQPARVLNVRGLGTGSRRMHVYLV